MDLKKPPPLREAPDQPDPQDDDRVLLVRERWSSQDEAYIGFERTVEEHVRMLSGRQWDVWSEVLGRYVDPLRYMTDEERRWRQRPVVDYLGYWYMVTLSKVTENMPIVGYQPSTADEKDARLAEVADPIAKTLWDQTEMPKRYLSIAGWCLASGEAYVSSRADYTRGPKRELIDEAVLSMEGADGSLIKRAVDAVPYDENGKPLAELVEGDDGEVGYDVTGDPFTDTEGEIVTEVLCPLEIRAQWGAAIPWTEKQWIIHRWFLTPDEVQRRWKVDVKPDVYAEGGEEGPGYLERLLFGSGYFGAARQDITATATTDNKAARDGYVCGYTMWEKPSEVSPESDDSPGGRLLVVAGEKVLWDSARPYSTEAAGPIRKARFVEIPGRPFGTTPLEKMVPLQKRLNRVEAQIAEHTNLCTNPVLLAHAAAGIDTEDFHARPGMIIEHDFNGPGDAAKWLAPPALGVDVWRHRDAIRQHLFVIGSVTGNDSETPTPDASGELVQQLRYNADRPLSPLTRALEEVAADVVRDWFAILPTIWTEEKVIAVAGEDSVVSTVTVLPDLWEGHIHVRPVAESAAPETREKKQARVAQLYAAGAWDPPGMPPGSSAEAKTKFLELSRFPELTRAARPGGEDRVMAERNLGALLRGEQADALTLLEVYDLSVHRMVFERYMKAPDYLEREPEVQEQMQLFYQTMIEAEQVKLLTAMEQQSDMATVEAFQANKVAAVAPQAPDSRGGAGPKQGASGPQKSTPSAGAARPAA